MTAPADLGTTRLADHVAVTELVSRMLLLVDARDWHELTSLFTRTVRVDYTSLWGGEPQAQTAAELAAGWRQTIGHLDATQHLAGNHIVTIDGDHATCAANVQATHVLANHSGGPTWTVGGRYDLTLDRTTAGWRISGTTLTVRWTAGNQHILQLRGNQGGHE